MSGEFKLGTSDLAMALAAGLLAGAASWRPGAVPIWLAVIPMLVLVGAYATAAVYQILIAHQWWRYGKEE